MKPQWVKLREKQKKNKGPETVAFKMLFHKNRLGCAQNIEAQRDLPLSKS